MNQNWVKSRRSSAGRSRVAAAAAVLMAVGILALDSTFLAGQDSASDHVLITRADTLYGPSGCTASAAITAIQTWFDAVTRGDTTEANRAFAPEMGWFSIMATDPDSPNPGGRTQFAAYDRVALYSYAKAAAGRRESLKLLSVEFNGWRGRELEMGPLTFERVISGGAARRGTGKAAYVCGRGLIVMSLSVA